MNSSRRLQTKREDVSRHSELDEIDTRSRMIQILDRLSVFIQTRWRSHAISYLDFSGRYPNIEMFADLIDNTAREANDPVFGNLVRTVKENRTGGDNLTSPFRNRQVLLQHLVVNQGVTCIEASTSLECAKCLLIFRQMIEYPKLRA